MTRHAQAEETLTRIVELAQEALDARSDDDPEDQRDDETGSDEAEVRTCTPKALPTRLQQTAARVARSFNPANAPLLGAMDGIFGEPIDPLKIAVLTAKYWGPTPRRLTVSFVESTSAALRNRILSHMNAWSTRCGINFAHTSGVGQVRISLGPGGYWSYLGTDILLIPKNRPTMNLERFSLNTPESEYRRVVRHETGHTLGCPHEHMRKALVDRIDRNKAYVYFLRTQGWDKATVDQQVLTPLNEASLMGTRPDQTSIMCYQLPGSITKNGKPIIGGTDINPTDYAFLAKLYPRPGTTTAHYTADFDRESDAAFAADQPHRDVDDWDASEDVDPADILTTS